MMEFIRQRALSFRYAFAGWWHVLSTQRNSWIHAVTSGLVLSLAILLSLPARDVAVLVLTIALVWTAEALNTAVEAVVDLASPQLHPLAKVSKDVGAAAVLIAALASILIGLLLLGPPLWAVVGSWLGVIGTP
jgi:diacylglycerol kinase (ATP)